ncbi:hypothetical protein [Shewanella psychrotolerans]|nr:hypothetical protein [Shewanella psychrotolerans]
MSRSHPVITTFVHALHLLQAIQNHEGQLYHLRSKNQHSQILYQH